MLVGHLGRHNEIQCRYKLVGAFNQFGLRGTGKRGGPGKAVESQRRPIRSLVFGWLLRAAMEVAADECH